MSNRRDLKKLINNSMELLYSDCIFYKVFTKNPNAEKADDIMLRMTEAHKELISRLSTMEGKEVKGRTKVYYKKVKSDLQNVVNNFGLEIQKLD